MEGTYDIPNKNLLFLRDFLNQIEWVFRRDADN